MKSLRNFAKCAVLSALTVGAALAQQGDFPSKTMRLVVPQGAGGSSDGLARIVAERLSLRWGKAVIVDNKPGAGGNIGSEIVAKSPPDGHTILLGYLGTSAINGALYKNLTYSPERDLVPAVGLATVPYVIVANPKLAARDLQELVRTAKARRVTYASAGTGTVNHLVGELFNSAAQVQMTHIPYKTAVQAMTDTMSGQTDINIGTVGTMFQQVKSGLLKPLAVLTPQRMTNLPDLPTAIEAGYPQLTVNAWFGLFVPVGTPRAVVQRIHADTNEVLRGKDVQDKLAGMGAEPMVMSLEGFEEMVSSDIRKWGKVTRDSGATAE